MAQTIKRTVDIQYQAKGLDEIQKQLSKTSLFSGDSEVLKNLKREIEEYSAAFAGQEGGVTDPAMAKEMSKKYASILKLFEKYRLELLKAVDIESASAVDGLNEEIEATEKLIANKQKIVDLVKERYVVEETGQLKAKTPSAQKETLEEAAKVVGAPKEKMVGIKGREIKTPVAIAKNGEEVLAALDKISNKNTEINEKLRNGENLTADQKAELDKILEVARAKGEIDKDFKNSAKEINDLTIYKNQLEAEQKKIIEERVKLMLGPAEDEIDKLQTDLAAKIKIRDEINNQKIAVEDLSDAEKEKYNLSNEMYKKGAELNAEHTKQTEKRKEAEKDATDATKKGTDAVNEQGGAFTKAAKQVFNYGIAFNVLRRIYRETIQTITELDKALTEMTVVTTMSRKEAWNLIPTMEKLAKETGFTTTQVAELTTEYLKQGRTLRDSITLAEAAAKAARIAGISAAESVSYLTSAINGFSLAADDAMMVSDKFAALAAASATDYEELANGLSKFAAQANIAGMSMDFALGMLAKGIETTREAPETIGTALKTVIARMRELTDLGKTLEDGMDVNRVERALGQVGIQLRDTNGQFRDMESVLTEVGKAWATFDTNQRASVAVALAGTRQQSRLIAIMNDFDRTLELVETSQDSAGATAAQHIEYMKGMEAAMAQLRTAWQQFITTITNSELIIGTIRLISSTISGLANGLKSIGFSGQTAMFGILAAAGALKIFTTWGKAAAVITGIQNALTVIFNKQAAESVAILALQAGANTKLSITQLIAIASTYGLSAAFDALWASMTAGVATAIKWIIVGLTTLIVLLVGAKQEAEGGTGFFVEMFKMVKAVASSIVSFVKSLIRVFNSLKPLLILMLVLFSGFAAPIFATVAALKILGYLLRVVAVGLEHLASWINKIPGLENLMKVFKNLAKETGKFFNSIEKNFSKWEQNNNDMTKSYEQLTASIEKANQKSIAENYELKQKNKEINKLLQEYEELSSKEIKTEEDLDQLENLKQGIRELNKEFVKSDGTIDNTAMLKAIAENEKEIQKNLRESAYNNIRLARKDFDKFISDQSKVDIIGSFISYELGDLTTTQQQALSTYYDNLLKANEKKIKNAKTDKQKEAVFSQMEDQARNYAGIIGEIETSFNEFELGDNSLSKKVNLFNSELAKLDGEEAKALKELFPELVFLTEKFGDEINNIELQNMFKELGMDSATFNSVSEALKGTGRTVEGFMTSVAERQAELEKTGVSSSVAFARAWSEQTSGIQNAESRITLYGLAAKKSTRDVAGSIDLLNSKIKRVAETQDKFMKGELSDTELFEFLDEYGDLIGDEGLQKFMQGGDIGKAIRQEIREAQDGYRQTIETYKSRLKTATGAEAEDLRIKILQLETLIEYSNELSRVTERQYKLNSIQEQYNRLKEIGANTDEISLELLQAQAALAEESINNANEIMNDLEGELRSTLGSNYKNYFDIVNGVLVWNYEKLKADGKQVEQTLREQYQEALDVTYNFYKDLMKQSLDREKKIADEKKKVYEDYFAALDRLEEKREREQSRADIMTQLQRLEGATDEKSRQKAKELRKELNEMDKENAKKSAEESRKALLDSIEEAYTKLEEKWGSVYVGLANAGQKAGKNFINTLVDSGLLDESFRVTSDETPGFAEGGIVDYTGIAKVHGSYSKPEAFLNAEQTQIFAGLRDYLGNLDISSKGGQAPINIQNITISTQQLNNKQDFGAAGKMLAEEFSKAISRRGVSVNTKR